MPSYYNNLPSHNYDYQIPEAPDPVNAIGTLAWLVFTALVYLVACAWVADCAHQKFGKGSWTYFFGALFLTPIFAILVVIATPAPWEKKRAKEESIKKS